MLFSAGIGIGIGRQTAGGMTYAQFLASITAKATNGSKLANDIVPFGAVGAGKFIVPFSGVPSMTMAGSPWLSIHSHNPTRYGASARHCYPTETPFTENTGANRSVYMDVEYIDDREIFPALNRNGFLSTGFTTGDGVRSAYRVVQFAWWDNATGMPMTNNPFTGSAPVLYTG
jgi:hypothetical protein